MSVRIYQLARQLGLDNKKVIELLQSKGMKVTSASSTIPNVYADEFIKEGDEVVYADLEGEHCTGVVIGVYTYCKEDDDAYNFIMKYLRGKPIKIIGKVRFF